jgi:hypothetical protein
MRALSVLTLLAVLPARGVAAQSLDALWRGGPAVNELVLASRSAQPARERVQAGVEMSKDTVTVGDPFTMTVRLRVPPDATVLWPVLSDSSAKIAPRAPMSRRDGPANVAFREELADFVVAAWDTGRVNTGWDPILVVIGSDTVRVALASNGVYVRSVLSADTAEHVPRPAKPVFAQELPWWQQWWIAALVLLALATLAYLLWRRRRKPVLSQSTGPRLGAYEHAMHAFDRLDRLALTDAGEHGRASVLALDILRGYLSARIPATSRAQTSAELLAVVGDDTRVPLARLIQLLVAVDAVKFARRALTATDARHLTSEARAVVQSVEEVERVRRAHAEAVARAQAEKDGRKGKDAEPREPAGVA